MYLSTNEKSLSRFCGNWYSLGTQDFFIPPRSDNKYLELKSCCSSIMLKESLSTLLKLVNFSYANTKKLYHVIIRDQVFMSSADQHAASTTQPYINIKYLLEATATT